MAGRSNGTGQLAFPSHCLELLVQQGNSSVGSGLDPAFFDCIDPNSAFYDVLKDTRYAACLITLYTLVIVVGSVGNILVVATVARSRQMWNATNIFIANLALADVFVCVFEMPMSAYYQLTDQWIFGPPLCHVIPPLWAVVVFASALTLTMIAIDRFVLIVYPLHARMSVKMALVFVVIIALISGAVASPIAAYSHYEEIEDVELKLYKSLCIERWPTTQQRRLYSVLTVAFQFVLPLVVIGILYFLIFRSVRGRMQGGTRSRRTRTTKMLLAVVLAFAITYTPWHICTLLWEFGIKFFPTRYFRFVDATMRGFAMSSSCINPFLYAWMNDNFRTAFIGLFRRSRKNDLRSSALHANKDNTRVTTKSEVAMGAVRVRDDLDRSYLDERSNANDVSVPDYNRASREVAPGATTHLLAVDPRPANGIIVKDDDTLTKPLLTK